MRFLLPLGLFWVLAISTSTQAYAASSHAPGRMFLKMRSAPDGGPRKAGPQVHALLGDALRTARPLSRRQTGRPLAAGLDRLYEVTLPTETDVARLAAKLSRLDEVEYAEPVRIYQTQVVPNDPSYAPCASQFDPCQSHLDKLQVEAAWDVQKSEDGVPRPVICVVDGGTNIDHEDLAGNLWTNPGEIPGDLMDNDLNGYIDDVNGWNFQSDTANPRGDFVNTPSLANHGTHTGGILGAVTDNGVGIAAASWNPLLMSVNAGGTTGGIAYGYSGIVYAAENGADIVSLSWGGSGGSLALQDIIDFAVAEGVLVLAATGNDNSSQRFYPAAYDNVYAVANVWDSDVRYGGVSGSNYGGWADVAAPGASIYSTFDRGVTNQYGNSTGTSMSCPVAASVAALIKAQNPAWGPLKVGEQLRITCDDINSINPGFEDLLGKGRVNALRAVTESSPAIRITSWTLDDADGNGELNQGEIITMSFVAHNYHDPAITPTFTLTSTTGDVTINDGSEVSATILEDADVSLPNAFTFTVGPNVPPGTEVDLRIDIQAAGYDDFQFIPILIEPLFETHDINNVLVSITGTGGLGWIGFPSALGNNGAGFRFEAGPNVLFEGALLVGTGPDNLSDAARESGDHTDFTPVAQVPPIKNTPGALTDQEIQAAFTDSTNTTTPLGVRIDHTSFASSSAPNDDFVIVCYEIQNQGGSPLDDLWVGLFFDWDIDEQNFSTNQAGYDATRRLGYAWDTTPGLPYVGVMGLSGPSSGYSAIRNDGTGAPWSVYDGFTKSEKWDVLDGGTGVLIAGPADISNALSAGPFLVEPDQTIRVYFALLAGSNLADLQANADLASAFYSDSIVTDVTGPPPARGQLVRLGPPSPNPFNPSTRFDLDVRETRTVSVSIYNSRGRHVTTLTNGVRTPGRHPIFWNGEDRSGRRVASGTYFARLHSGDLVQVRRVILAK